MGCISSQDLENSQQLSHPQIFFVLGGPGSGKGTQCDNLVRDYKFKHLSVGDLLREERAKGGPQAQQIEQTMKEGKLVSSELAVKLIRKAIAINGVRRYLIDGFPRNKENWERFQQIMKDEVVVRGLIYFECDNDIMTERILNRAKTSGRVDDNPDAIKLRLETFHNQTLPVLEIFKKNEGFLAINARQTPDKVYEEVKVELQKRKIEPPQPAEVFFVLGGPGSGKGTQCEFMVKEYGFRHLSTGDLLREAVKYGYPKGKQIEACMKEGKLVSSELLIGLVKDKIQRYLLDGFPRGQENITVWNQIMASVTEVRGVIYFECEEKELIARLLERAKTSGRSDDNEETIKKRITVFNTETAPVIKAYGDSGKILKINAMESIDKVSGAVAQTLKTLGITPKIKKAGGARLIPVIGGPGSGKGTQCDKLKEVFGFRHISTGDLLREEQKSDGLYSDLLDDYLKEGRLVPSQLLVLLMRKALQRMGNEGTILIDGFPRNQENIDKWNEVIGSEFQFTNLIYFDCSEAEMSKRLLERGKTSGRSDDNADTIKKRLDVFNKETRPVANKLDRPGFFIRVNADRTKQQVFEDLKLKLIQTGYTAK